MRRIVLSIVIAVIVGAIISSRGWFSSNDSKLEATARDLNKTLPKMMDEITRCDHVTFQIATGTVLTNTRSSGRWVRALARNRSRRCRIV